MPARSTPELEWVATGAMPALTRAPVWEDVFREYIPGQPARMPWSALAWDAGDNSGSFVPGLPRRHVAFWKEVILKDHLRDEFVSFLQEGVGLYDLLLEPYRGLSIDQPYNVDMFPGRAKPNRIPGEFVPFVRDELSSLLARGCVAKSGR